MSDIYAENHQLDPPDFDCAYPRCGCPIGPCKDDGGYRVAENRAWRLVSAFWRSRAVDWFFFLGLLGSTVAAVVLVLLDLAVWYWSGEWASLPLHVRLLTYLGEPVMWFLWWRLGIWPFSREK